MYDLQTPMFITVLILLCRTDRWLDSRTAHQDIKRGLLGYQWDRHIYYNNQLCNARGNIPVDNRLTSRIVWFAYFIMDKSKMEELVKHIFIPGLKRVCTYQWPIRD